MIRVGIFLHIPLEVLLSRYVNSSTAKVESKIPKEVNQQTNLTNKKYIYHIFISENGPNYSISVQESVILRYSPQLSKDNPLNRHSHGSGPISKKGSRATATVKASTLTFHSRLFGWPSFISSLSSSPCIILSGHPSATIHIRGNFHIHHRAQFIQTNRTEEERK